MTLGKLFRKLLGNSLSPKVAGYYRRMFVDLEKLAECICDWLPRDAHVLDIGGGDGEPLNPILARRPDVSFTLLDLSPCIGGSVQPGHKRRVRLLPGVSLRIYIDEYLRAGPLVPDCVLLSDVLHHIPPAERTSFLSDLHDLFLRTDATLLFKEFQPGSLISWLGYVSDRFVSGDQYVRFLSSTELKSLIRQVFGAVEILDTGLFRKDKPNYLVVIPGKARTRSV